MKTDNFNQLLEYILARARQSLSSKGHEYSTEEDKLHNFKRAAQILGVTTEQALMGMYIKHLVSVLDMIDNINKGIYPTKELLEEKNKDSINYHILLEAIIRENMGE